MRREILVVLVLILLPATLFAQTPAAQPQTPAPVPPAAAPKPSPATPPAVAATAAGGARVGVIDFQRAITENADGKKAQDKFMAEINKRQEVFTQKQKSLDDMQNKLKTQGPVLNDETKADLSKQIDRTTTELQRMNDDAQKELGELQQQLF